MVTRAAYAPQPTVFPACLDDEGDFGVLESSAPTQDSGTPTSWDADALNSSNGADTTVQAFVICALP